MVVLGRVGWGGVGRGWVGLGGVGWGGVVLERVVEGGVGWGCITEPQDATPPPRCEDRLLRHDTKTRKKRSGGFWCASYHQQQLAVTPAKSTAVVKPDLPAYVSSSRLFRPHSPPRAGYHVPSILQNAHPVVLFAGVVYVPPRVRHPRAHGTVAESKEAHHLRG